jgi:peptidoglycan hydrolase CwlO-like protein
MTTDQIGMIIRELDKINENVEKVDAKVEDVRERVTRLETSSNTTMKMIGLLIAGVPVIFLIMDRLTSSG